jgi:ATP-binding cassette subfamily B protein
MKKNKNIDFKYNLKEYWKFLFKYKFIVVATILVALIAAATALVPRYLFKLIIDGAENFLKETLTKPDFVEILIYVAVTYLVVSVIRVVNTWFKIDLINRLDANLMRDVKTKYFNHVLKLSHNFHTTHKTGSLISRVLRGSGAIERMTDIVVFNVLPLLFTFIVVGGSILYFSWIPALITFATLTLFIVYSLFVQQKQRKYNVIANDTEDIEKAHLSDYFLNIDSIKHFGKEKAIEKRFRKFTENSRSAWIKFWEYYRLLDAGQLLILEIGTFFLIYFPLVQFLNNEITLSTVVFIYTSFLVLMGPLFGFVHGVRGFYRSMADFESLFQYGKIENEIKDKKNAKNLVISKGNIEFDKVSFRYHKKKGLLDEFSLKIPRNHKVAFVGHSGCGKTTLIKLIYRLYDVQKGSIKIDGTDIRDVKQESLRGELSIVPQEAVLFDDTIYNNIKFSNPKATRAEVFKAMRFAQLDKFVNELPKKERTIVGERGVKLSGGEKQRVSIARAILANKKILVLDEATSALDSETEHEIQRDLERLMKGRTSIIIAHRLSTIMKADTIVVLKRGKIIQMGNHRQLIRREGEYRRLWNLQKGGYIK